MSVIALMTDFGTRDHYVAVMKGVMLQINGRATIIDVTHDIRSQDLVHGAFVLRQTLPYFPTGTIFVAVVDPTVGTDRPILAARYNDRIVIAPDNGLLTLLHRDADLQEIRRVENRSLAGGTISRTFHGRDIFAPVAAHLAAGVDPAKMGPEIHDPVWLDQPGPTVSKNRIECRVEYIDRYGNLVTDLTQPAFREWLSNNGGSPEKIRVQFYSPVRGEVVIAGLSNSYGERGEGELLAVFDGYDRLEISVRNGDARRETGLETGSPVTVGA